MIRLPSWLAYIRAYFRAPKHARCYVMDALFMLDKDLGGVGPTGCKIEIFIEPEGSKYGGGSVMTPLNEDGDDIARPKVCGNTVTASSTPTYSLTINNAALP